MTAPALVALAHGSRDPRSAATIKALVDEVRAMRPDLRIEPAFLDLSKPSFHDGRRPARQGRVRRDRRRPAAAHRGLPRQGRRARGDRGRDRAAREPEDPRHPRARSGGRLPRGPRPAAAHRAQGRPVRELDALVLAAAGSSDALANQAVARLARLWGAKHKLPTVAAFASAAPPATGEAVRQFRAEGRRHIAVGSLFLAPGRLPDRAAELALEAGAVAVSDAAGRRPGGGPDHPGPLRRRRGGARPGLTLPDSSAVSGVAPRGDR